MLSPTVQLRSGGYLVINQTEALVAIDVNSGRATRERGIEETALRTNLEAADEAARQLRLRDLAGLIVIDFIDMEVKKHNSMVERRMKEALKNDRARIQLGHISHFGLLEMSRQRLRPSLAESSLIVCPHCRGLGHVRSVESRAVHVLRGIEEEGSKARASLIMVHTASEIAMYILNNKRERLAEVEARYSMRVHFEGDADMPPPDYRIDRLRPPIVETERPAPLPVAPAAPIEEETEAEAEVAAEAGDEEVEAETTAPVSDEAHTGVDEGDRRRRRRRRRRGGRREGVPSEAEAAPAATGEETEEEAAPGEDETEDAQVPADLAAAEQPEIGPAEMDENGLPRSRRRGRRGGRRRGRREEVVRQAEPAPAPPAAPPYVGPTPAEPFGPETYDIFDMIEEAEQQPAHAKAPEPALAETVAVAEPAPIPEPVPALETALVAEAASASAPVAEPPPEPDRVAAAPEPVEEHRSEPAIRPVIIGKNALPEPERKRGWWRR
jgi:ribonuclease E